MEELSMYLKVIKKFNKYNLLSPDLETSKDSIFSHKVLTCVSLISNVIINIVSHELPNKTTHMLVFKVSVFFIH